MCAKRKVSTVKLDPELMEKERAALVRTHRQVILFNDREMAAIDECCRRFKISSRSSLLRQAVMEHVLEMLEENHPTLF